MNKFTILVLAFSLQWALPAWATSQPIEPEPIRYILKQAVSVEKAREACMAIPLRHGAIHLSTKKIINEVDKTRIEFFNFIFIKEEHDSFAVMPLTSAMHISKDGLVHYISEFKLGQDNSVMDIYYSKNSDNQKFQFNVMYVELFRNLKIELEQWVEQSAGQRASGYSAGGKS